MTSSGENAARQLAGLLREKNFHIATAESCTGGMVGALLTAIPGISELYEGGVVAYQNRVKEKLLQVPHTILATRGAVSLECASAMAEGAARLFHTECAVATTGIAGPGGGSAAKPVGTVCFGVRTPDGVQSFRRHFSGSREEVRRAAAEYVLELLIELLKR